MFESKPDLKPKNEKPQIPPSIPEQIQVTDSLDSLEGLDNINYEKAEKWNKEPAVQELIRELTEDVQKSQTASLVRKEMLSSNTDSPETFDEMLDSSVGTSWQRLQKWYMKMGNSENSKKVLESIGVKEFRRVVRNIMFSLVGKQATGESKIKDSDNYFLTSGNLNSLIDFAVNKTLLNEKVHLIGVVLSTLAFTGEMGRANIAQGGFWGGSIILNLYCILAQKYTRNQLGRLIDKKLKKHAKFDIEKYKNDLGIKLPR